MSFKFIPKPVSEKLENSWFSSFKVLLKSRVNYQWIIEAKRWKELFHFDFSPINSKFMSYLCTRKNTAGVPVVLQEIENNISPISYK